MQGAHTFALNGTNRPLVQSAGLGGGGGLKKKNLPTHLLYSYLPLCVVQEFATNYNLQNAHRKTTIFTLLYHQVFYGWDISCRPPIQVSPSFLPSDMYPLIMAVLAKGFCKPT